MDSLCAFHFDPFTQTVTFEVKNKRGRYDVMQISWGREEPMKAGVTKDVITDFGENASDDVKLPTPMTSRYICGKNKKLIAGTRKQETYCANILPHNVKGCKEPSRTRV